MLIRKETPRIDNLESPDAILVCKDGNVMVHRVVLAATSSWLRQILQISEIDEEITTIHMKDFHINELQPTFNFFYGRSESLNKNMILGDLRFDIFDPKTKEQRQNGLKDFKDDLIVKEEIKKETSETDPEFMFDLIEYYGSNAGTGRKKVRRRVASGGELEQISIPIDQDHDHRVDDVDSIDEEVEGGDDNDMVHDDDYVPPLEEVKVKKKRGRPPKGTKVVKIPKVPKDKKERKKRGEKDEENDEPSFCGECGKKFATKDNLTRHMKYVHGNTDEKYKCEECSYETTRRYHLKEHRARIHQGVTYPCDQCEYQSGSKHHLKFHIKTKHEGFRLQCDQCDFTCIDHSTLRLHKQGIHENIKYPCKECSYVGNKPKDLYHHNKNCHMEKQVLCDECDMAFAKVSCLKEHKLIQHEGVRFQCEFCDYTTKARSSLRDHRRVKHLGIRMQCDQCGYTAGSQSHLKSHKERKHDGVRKYCDLCDYSTFVASSLIKHKKITHEGQRFFCDYCYYSATTKMIVKKHKLKKHPDEMSAAQDREKAANEANVDDEGLLQHQLEIKNTPPAPMIPPPAATAVSIVDNGGGHRTALSIGDNGGGHTDYINRAFYFPK